MSSARLLPLLLGGLLLQACDARARVDEDSGAAALMRNLLDAGRVELVVPAGTLLEPARRAARLRRRELDGYTLELASPGGDAHLPRVVLGSFQDPLARGLAEFIGVHTALKSGEARFTIAEREFGAPADAFLACFEDPERPGLPLTLYYANDDAHLARLVAHGLGAGWKPSLRAWSDGRELLAGPLGLSGRILPARLARSPVAQFSPLPERGDGIFGRMQAGCPPARLDALLESIARARAAVRAWAAPESELPRIELVAYARAEDYTAVAGADEPAVLDPLARRVHACLAPGLPIECAPAARAAARALLGECALPWLEDGAAVEAAGTWWGQPLESWLDWIAARHLELPLERVLDARADELESPHLVLPLRALLFRVLRETRTPEELRALWTGAHELVLDAALAQGFASALAKRVPSGLESGRRPPNFPVLDQAGRQAWRGVEGEPALGGPGWTSEAGMKSLALAQELGANALGLRISIVARPDPLALPDPFRPRRVGTCEGDLEIFGALAAARARGMAGLLDLDLLATPSGIEDGAWLRVRPEQWQRFFAAREKALVHAGLLAELARADVLTIGSGLSAVSRDQVEGRKGKNEDLERKHAGWSAVLARTRASFGGALAYVSSGADLELALFWKDLDAIGFRLDERGAPAGGKSAPGRDELEQRMRAALERVATVAAQHKKPWFLARTGFEPGPPGVSEQLEALGGALTKLPPASRPVATFLWRWSSDPDDRGLDPRDVLLARPETLEALRKLWRLL